MNQRWTFCQKVLGGSAAAAGANGAGLVRADGANGAGLVGADGAKGAGLVGSDMVGIPPFSRINIKDYTAARHQKNRS
jgi:hypothetical protein